MSIHLVQQLQDELSQDLEPELINEYLKFITVFGRTQGVETSTLTTSKERFARFIIRLQLAIDFLRIKHKISVFASTIRVGNESLGSLIGPTIAEKYMHYVAHSLSDPGDKDFMESLSVMITSPNSSIDQLVESILDPGNGERISRIYKFIKKDTYFNMNFTRAIIQHLIDTINSDKSHLSTDTSEMAHLPEEHNIYQEIDVFMNALVNIYTSFKWAYQMHSGDPENTGEFAAIIVDDNPET